MATVNRKREKLVAKHIRLPQETSKKLNHIAQTERRTISATLEVLILNHYNKNYEQEISNDNFKIL